VGDIYSIAISGFAPVAVVLKAVLNVDLASKLPSLQSLSEVGGGKAPFAAFSSGVASLKAYGNALDLVDGPYWPLTPQTGDSGPHNRPAPAQVPSRV
jgi:hypothetical protein